MRSGVYPYSFTHHTHTQRAQYNYFVLYYFPEVTSHLVSRNPPNISSQEKIASFCIETPSLHTIFTLHSVQDIYFFFLAAPHSLWDPSSQNWD